MLHRHRVFASTISIAAAVALNMASSAVADVCDIPERASDNMLKYEIDRYVYVPCFRQVTREFLLPRIPRWMLDESLTNIYRKDPRHTEMMANVHERVLPHVRTLACRKRKQAYSIGIKLCFHLHILKATEDREKGKTLPKGAVKL